MITAIVNINAAVDRIPEVAQAIADLDGVSEVYSVAGDVARGDAAVAHPPDLGHGPHALPELQRGLDRRERAIGGGGRRGEFLHGSGAQIARAVPVFS